MCEWSEIAQSIWGRMEVTGQEDNANAVVEVKERESFRKMPVYVWNKDS